MRRKMPARSEIGLSNFDLGGAEPNRSSRRSFPDWFSFEGLLSVL